MNITTLFFSSIGIIFSLIFIFIILYNRSLRTIPNILTLNSAIAILLLSSDTFSIGIYVLYRDIKRRQLQMEIEMKSLFLCHLRGCIAHISFCALVYSYAIQACYRLVGTIFYHRVSYNHLRIYVYAISIQWSFAILQLLPIILGNNQIYIKHEYLCQIAIENSKAIGYICFTNYLIPLTIIMIIYYKITRSVRKKENNGAYKYNIHRVRRQVVLIQRIVILILVLLVLGGPYSIFIILEALSIKRAPSYAHRIGFMFISIACASSIITIIYFARSIRKMIIEFLSIKKKSLQRNELQRLNSIRNMELTPKRMPMSTTDDTCIGIISSLIFIFIILYNRSLRTIANILTLNSTAAILIMSSDTLAIGIYVLYRDIKRRQLQMEIEMKSLFLCHVCGYIAHMSFGALVYSYVIQACYRLVGTIFYHQFSYNNLKIYMYAICAQWSFAILQLLPIILGNNQIYIKHEYLCQIAFENSKAIGYLCVTNYLIPLTIIMIIYYKITRSVREKENNGTYRYNIHRTRRQVVLTQRILILIAILFVLGGPYTVFIILEALSIASPPVYSHRIGFMFISVASTLSIITIIYFARSVSEIIVNSISIKKKMPQKYELQRLNSIKLTPIMYTNRSTHK
ncbi:unnamed protein product [Adineta steineri]|uniref:G-protein coupled receptors family 1 profile domain-containing protein n=1 Tax=Adineta steineri TaxID=433720 RepID=A0A819BQJ7_9BILA|nr:unnamed protein product [Adineta steineri]CAF3807521.1 unnamed protein product [Adineta steineri]